MPLDWMAGFLETHVRPRTTDMRREFQRTYVEIFNEWAADPVHESAAYDTERLDRFKRLAEARMQSIVRDYDRRFLLKALRTVPAHVMGLATISRDFDEMLPLLREATLAVWLYARPTQDSAVTFRERTHGLQLRLSEVEHAQRNLAVDLGRLLGAAFARSTAERAYRYAGKGGRLKRPDPPTAGWTEVFDRYPVDGIVLVDSPRFEDDAALEAAVAEYDRRRANERRVGASGMPELRSGSAESTHFGWRAALVGNPVEPVTVEVSYPALRISHFSTCMMVVPCDVATEMELLRQFRDRLEERLGFGWEMFSALWGGLFNAVRRETGYDRLKPPRFEEKRICIESALRPGEPASASAPGFLYSALCGGTLRGPRAGFVRYLTGALAEAGMEPDSTVAERFIERFSRHDGIDTSFSPSLFFPVDRDLVVLDFALMNEFLELCLRVATSGDGEIGNRRAGLFEEHARDRLIRALDLADDEMPVRPNEGIKEGGKDYGDVDFAFVRRGVLVNLDMKSWQRRPGYFRGDFHEIQNRRLTLEALYQRVEERGVVLARRLVARGISIRTVVNLLCVAESEFVAPDAARLWYGDMPKVLTADEIAHLVRDPERWGTVVAAASGRA
jgi:hypothetical protein